MAFELSGNVEVLRIIELLTKVLAPTDLANYYVAIDKDGDTDTKRASLAEILAFVAGGATSFADNIFEIFNVGDGTKVFNFDASSISTSTTITLTIPDVSGLIAVAGMVDAFSFGGQAHGGDNVRTFSASTTFDSNNGNNQSMDVTASTNIGISNELPGTYIFELEIDTAGAPTITPNANLGTVMDNSADFINADNDINIITVYVNPSGAKKYTINTITA